MNWMQKIVDLRLSNFTNVFLIETEDPLDRVEQLRRLLTTDALQPKRMDGTHLKRYPEFFEIDMLNGMAYMVTETATTSINMAKVWQNFYNVIASGMPTAAIIWYPYRQIHAETLADRLLSFTFDPAAYITHSTIFVLTVSWHLWPKPLLRFIGVIDANATDEDLENTVKRIEELRNVKVPPEVRSAVRGLSMSETRSSILLSLLRTPGFADINTAIKTIEEVKRDKLAKLGLRMRTTKETFDHIGGYENIKLYVRRFLIAPLRNPGRARALGIEPPRGVLLFGPPGTGKSLFARVIAGESGLPFMELDASQVFGSLVGETEARIARIRDTLERMGPTVLFVDEAEAIFPHRGKMVDTAGGTFTRATNMMLSWLGDADRKTIIVMTSNYPDRLDPALLRRGRIDVALPVLYPDFEARLEILKVHTSIRRKVPLAQDVDLEKIAEETDYWSGADLEALVQDAARIALAEDNDEVTMEHFNKAMENYTINRSERMEWLRNVINAILSQPDAPVIRSLLPQQLHAASDLL